MRKNRKRWTTVLATALAAVLALTPAAAVKAATADEVWAAAKASGQTADNGSALPDNYGSVDPIEDATGQYYSYKDASGNFIVSFSRNPSWLTTSSSSSGSGDGLSAEQAKAREEAKQRAEAAAAAEASNVSNATILTGARSTASGSYHASSVDGTAVITPREQLGANLGLGQGETAYVTTWDIAASQSPDAAKSLQTGADSVGGTIGPMLQVNINKFSNGSLLPLDPAAGSLQMTFGVPGSLRAAGGEIAAVRVISGGEFEILRDLDNNAYTFTANIPAGDAAYALMRLPK